jgi:hypothetical protein
MDQTQAAANLTTDLRVWLRARPESSAAQTVALAYEIAALVARHCATVPQAVKLIELWTDEMKGQIQEYGVGVEHP